jgi:hypothetical protein
MTSSRDVATVFVEQRPQADRYRKAGRTDAARQRRRCSESRNRLPLLRGRRPKRRRVHLKETKEMTVDQEMAVAPASRGLGSLRACVNDLAQRNA